MLSTVCASTVYTVYLYPSGNYYSKKDTKEKNILAAMITGT